MEQEPAFTNFTDIDPILSLYSYPWEETHDPDPYDEAQSELALFDAPHYPAINKPEGGPFHARHDRVWDS